MDQSPASCDVQVLEMACNNLSSHVNDFPMGFKWYHCLRTIFEIYDSPKAECDGVIVVDAVGPKAGV